MTMQRIFFLILIPALVSAGPVACKRPPSDSKGAGNRPAVLSKETRLASIAETVTLRGVEISPMGNNFAYYAAAPDNKVVMMIGVKEAGVYDNVKDFKFSPDERYVAYIARMNNKEYLMLNGKKTGKGYDSVDNPVFSPDGRLVAYEASEQGKYFIVVGNRESEHYDMSSMPPLFSGDGKQVLYILQDYSAKKIIVFITEAHSSRIIKKIAYDAVGLVALSADGKSFAFPAIEQRKFHLVQGEFSTGDMKKGMPLNQVDKVALSPDGSAAAYLSENNGKRLLMIGKRSWNLLKNEELFSAPIFSPNGTRAAWVIVKNGAKRVVVDGVMGPAYDDVSQPVFTPDGARVAYSAKKGEKFHLVLGDRKGPAFDMVIPPVFSPDSLHVAYRVRDNNQRFIVLADAEAKTVKQLPPHEAVWQPVFTTDGKQLAYGVGTLPVKELWWKVEPVNGSK